MEADKLNKIALLILAILPSILYFAFGPNEPNPENPIFQLYAISLFGVTLYYFLMARKNEILKEHRFRWLILLAILLLSPFSLVFYWFKYIWSGQ